MGNIIMKQYSEDLKVVVGSTYHAMRDLDVELFLEVIYAESIWATIRIHVWQCS